MAVSNISTNLNAMNPVYNPLVYMFDSTNKNQPGFRYVVDVYNSTPTKIAEFRIAPRPTDGYGEIDLSKILADHLSFDIDLTNTTSAAVLNSFFKYSVKIGEEYQVSWPFTDSVFDAGKTKLEQVPNTQAHTFVAGDQIVVMQTTPSNFPTLEGLQTVESVPDAYNIIINIPFVSSPANPGIVKYADNRNTITRDLLTYSNQVVWNGALSFKDWPSYTATDYQITSTSTTKKLLTNIPTNFYCATTQDIWINWIPYLSSTPTYAYFENSNGDIFRKNIQNTLQELRQFSAGPNNVGTLSLVSGTATLVKSDTTYYDFFVTNSTGTQMSKKYRINIDRRCPIENYEIVFQDRLGSFASFAFPLRNSINGTITRDSYNRQVGDLSSGKWTYNVSEPGMVHTNISISKEYTLSTNWITNEMDVYFEELVTSPVTYVKIDGVYYSCVILDTSIETQSQNLKKLIKRQIKIKLSSENIVNI